MSEHPLTLRRRYPAPHPAWHEPALAAAMAARPTTSAHPAGSAARYVEAARWHLTTLPLARHPATRAALIDRAGWFRREAARARVEELQHRVSLLEAALREIIAEAHHTSHDDGLSGRLCDIGHKAEAALAGGAA